MNKGSNMAKCLNPIFILFASAGDGGERVKPEGILVFLHLGPGLLYQSGGWLIADIF